jgi:hypothetical protein
MPSVVINPFQHARQPPSLFGSLQRTPALQRLPQRLPFRGRGHPLQSCREPPLDARCRDRLSVDSGRWRSGFRKDVDQDSDAMPITNRDRFGMVIDMS